MKIIIHNFNVALTSLMLSLFSVCTYAHQEEHSEESNGARVWKIKGTAVTGPNSLCGKPEWIMPAPFSPDENYTIMGSHDNSSGAQNSIRLSPTHCDEDLILATHQNPDLNALGGLPNSDPRIQNIPIHQVPIKATLDGVRMFLPPDSESNGNPFPPTRSGPGPITLGKWLSAEGKMNITCYPDGRSKVSAKFRRLIPNGVYTFVSTWLTVPPGAPAPTFVPMPMGGVPGELVADAEGSASFKRSLSYCPMDVTPDGSFILFVDLGYHIDGSTKGVFPQTAMQPEHFMMPDGQIVESLIAPGILTMPHVGFPMRVGLRDQ